jgi:hypothetical protein
MSLIFLLCQLSKIRILATKLLQIAFRKHFSEEQAVYSTVHIKV